MDLENFDFKSYLMKIGLEEEYAKMPAVIEVLKARLKDIKEDDEFEVTDTGIFYKEGIIRIDDGKLRVSNNSFFTEKNDSYVYIEDEFGSIKITVLDSYGTVQKILYSKKHAYNEEYESIKRMSEFDTPLIEYTVTYDKDSIVEEYMADYGDPVSLKSNTKSFEENYNNYTRKYPELEEWYESRYKVSSKDIREYSIELKERQNDLNIRMLNEQIERFDKYIESAKSREEEYKEKLKEKMNEFETKNFVKKLLYKPLIRELKEKFEEMDAKNVYKFDSNDEKLKIDHEKLEQDYTNPLSSKEKEVERLKNLVTDKKVELQELEKRISNSIKKIEIIKLKTENLE